MARVGGVDYVPTCPDFWIVVYRDADDGELLAGLREGDVAALDALLERYWSPLIAYLTRMSGTPDAAEDIAQQTFYRLWERRATWRPKGSVRGLLYRIAHNFAVSHHRADLARGRVHATGGQTSADPATPLERLENEELRDTLDRAIQALPPRRREVFILRCVHDMSYKEIARVMRISPQTVANQLSHALASLRAALRPQLTD